MAALRDEVRLRVADLYLRAPAALAAFRGPDHVFEIANSRFERIVGSRDLLGLRLRDVLPEEEGQRLSALLDRVYRSGEPLFTGELRVSFDRRGDGVLEEGFFGFDLEPIVEEGRVVGVAAAAIEVTDQVRARASEEAAQRARIEAEERLRLAQEAAEIDRKRAEEQRVALASALERSTRELDQFAYVASHDLRAPLRGIANLSLWMEEDLEGKLNEDERERMHLLRGRVQRLEALIDGILRYSRAGRVGGRIEAVDLGGLTAEVIDLLAPEDAVTLDVALEMPTILVERAPLQQVLSDLVSNALKHAGRPDPRIAISCTDTGTAYAITVKDDGQGIAPAHHERIWGIFQTLVPRDQVEGTGIGLSIVKKIVESRGGRAWVESAPGAGAAFHVLWPKRAEGSP